MPFSVAAITGLGETKSAPEGSPFYLYPGLISIRLPRMTVALVPSARGRIAKADEAKRGEAAQPCPAFLSPVPSSGFRGAKAMIKLETLLVPMVFIAFSIASPLFAQSSGRSSLTSNGQYIGQYSGLYSGQYSGHYSGQSTGQYSGGNAASQAAIERTLPTPVNPGACGELFATPPGTDFLLQDSQGRRC